MSPLKDSMSGRGYTAKTPENIERARALRAAGRYYREIAAELGVGVSTIAGWFEDPDGSRLRARKDSYRGTCAGCGGPVSGHAGPSTGPTVCLGCRPGYYVRWTKERIVQAMRDWAEEYGAQPTAMDWNGAMARRFGHEAQARRYEDGDWPSAHTVQRVFGSWNAAIAAAGFAPRCSRAA